MEFPYVVNLTYIFNNKNEILLQKKARGFGKGNWNGPGGKLDPGETIEESAIREVKEETDINMKSIEKRGEIEFIFFDHSINNCTHVFICKDWKGKPRNMGEGELKWFSIEDIPFDKMWADDKYWLIDLLSGKYIKMRFYFDENNEIKKFEEI